MDSLFPRSEATLEAEGIRGWMFSLLFVAVLLGGWALWFFRARVGVYAVSGDARLEVEHSVQPVEATVGGRLVTIRATLGQEVAAGELLFELDAEAQRLQLDEERARQRSFVAQFAALKQMIEAEQAALESLLDVARVSEQEGRARHEEADSSARFAAGEEARTLRLQEGGQVSEAALLAVRAEAEKRRAAVETQRLSGMRMTSELQSQQRGQSAKLAQLQRERALLEGQAANSSAVVARLQHDLGQRSIRAPVPGQLAEVAGLGLGAVVREGDRLASVVPRGGVRIIAEFSPPIALGRVQPGQHGQLRLAGFPWAQYGSLPATVSRVAAEPRSGNVRVELALDPDQARRVPLQHGLPGTVEVEVERVSPATLVWRAVGQRLAAPVASANPGAPPR